MFRAGLCVRHRVSRYVCKRVGKCARAMLIFALYACVRAYTRTHTSQHTQRHKHRPNTHQTHTHTHTHTHMLEVKNQVTSIMCQTHAWISTSILNIFTHTLPLTFAAPCQRSDPTSLGSYIYHLFLLSEGTLPVTVVPADRGKFGGAEAAILLPSEPEFWSAAVESEA
jgi:hypothetical protein